VDHTIADALSHESQHKPAAKETVTGKYLLPDEWSFGANGEVVLQGGANATTAAAGAAGDKAKAVEVVWEKMSKSKHNGVNPIDAIDQHGADATRLAMLFAAPAENAVEWDDSCVQVNACGAIVETL
jgi:leucyl-tRNA synthetase